MNTYSLVDVRNKLGEVFKLAATKPVVLTEKEIPSHVLISFKQYQEILDRLNGLEDRSWGKKGFRGISTQGGSERFYG
jgi:PHD/YefM family antitoxin component YafN of YafNO toxin-antitoxin module